VVGVGLLADGVDVAAGPLEFVLGQPDLAHEGVQMAHQRRHDFAKARIGCALDFAQHRLGDRIGAVDNHGPNSLASGGYAACCIPWLN
jgi:hypothetical protein